VVDFRQFEAMPHEEKEVATSIEKEDDKPLPVQSPTAFTEESPSNFSQPTRAYTD
jgi:hypothetical protein